MQSCACVLVCEMNDDIQKSGYWPDYNHTNLFWMGNKGLSNYEGILFSSMFKLPPDIKTGWLNGLQKQGNTFHCISHFLIKTSNDSLIL